MLIRVEWNDKMNHPNKTIDGVVNMNEKNRTPASSEHALFEKQQKYDMTNFAKKKAVRITFIYFCVGCFWILFSDKLAAYLSQGQSNYANVSILKGLFYVLITAVLIFTLIYSALKQAMDAQARLRNANEDLEKSMTRYKSLYQEFSNDRALLKSLFDAIPDLIFYKNSNDVYIGCNKAFEEFAGQPEQEIVGYTDFELFSRGNAEKLHCTDKKLIQKSEAELTYPDGHSVYFEIIRTPYYTSQGTVLGMIGIGRDISERKKKEEEIKYLNYHDTLTGLYNRTYVQTIQSYLEREDQLPLSVILGDVNGLKLINDAMGHSEGDKLLIKIGTILKKCARQSDVVARMGGDEFCILLPKTDSETAFSVVEKINKLCTECGNWYRDHENVFYANIALGYATKTTSKESLKEIMKAAEDFMYRRKLLEYKSLHSSILSSIKTTMFEKSNETEAHAERMAELSKKLGQMIGLSEEDLIKLELVATLHDIGKISIDQNILTKTEKLNDNEWREIRKHPEVGFRIANASPELRHISEYILTHHERWDGTGYPQGLSGENIPLISRIISIVDAYDAMTQDRSYRKGMPKEMAVSELTNHAGTQFDPELVKCFVEKVIV